MKKILIVALTVLLTSCYWGTGYNDGDRLIDRQSSYEPVILKRSELDTSIKMEAPKEIVESSKIYIFEDLFFITEKYKGFHIFDNSDSTKPTKMKFLKVPGATDISIRGNVLYINQATDLVTLSFNKDDYTIKLETRNENALTPYRYSPDREWFGVNEGEVIVGWKLKK